MNQNQNKVGLILLLILLTSCNTDDTETIDPFESYRYDLWKKLIDNNLTVNYIGTRNDSYYYETYSNHTFDTDHEGIGGIQTDGVLVNLETVLQSIEKPDIVLLGIGINDLLDGDNPIDVIINVKRVINILQRYNPEVTIIVEKIPALKSNFMSTEFEEKVNRYNGFISRLTNLMGQTGPNIVAIDMNSEFIDDYFEDMVHYNEAGANFISEKYLDAILNQFETETTTTLNILPLGDSRVVGYKVE